MPEQVALITGGARRVGAAIGRLLHRSGMSLMVHYRSSAARNGCSALDLGLQLCRRNLTQREAIRSPCCKPTS